MDGIVQFGIALVVGPLLFVAPAETAFAMLGGLALLCVHSPVRRLPLLLAFLAVGLGAWRAMSRVASHEASRDSVRTAMSAPARCAGYAEVVGSPVMTHGTLRWEAELQRLECDGARGPPAAMRATLYGGPSDLARGDRLEVVAQLAVPQRLWNSATGDPRPGEARRRVLLSGGIVDARRLRLGGGWYAAIDRARARVRARIEATFSPSTAPMARAIVLGESDLEGTDDADFRASGLAHLLAVSGMHLVLVIAGSVRALRAVLVRVPQLAARIDVERLASALGVPAAWAYAEFAGAGGSTLRAAWMMTAALVARAIGRRSSAGRAFGLSLIAIGVVDPLVVFDASFLLSAAATAGLITLSRPIAACAERLFERASVKEIPRLLRWGLLTGSATLSATIPCTPILARFAPTVPLGGVLANLLAVPVGESIALPVCLLHALLAPLPLAERGCALAASGALAVVRAIAHRFAHTEWLLLSVPPPTGWQLACIALALVVVIMRARRLELLCILAGLVLLAEVDAQRCGAPKAALRATFLDVGQGDATLVDLPDGDAMLIDGGGLVGSPIDTGTRVVAPALRERRRSEVATVVLSHPHPDHFGGLSTGLGAVRVRALWDTGQGEREGIAGGYGALLAGMHKNGVPVLRPPELCGAHQLGGARVEVLAPCPEPSPDRGPNDNSLVVRITFGRRTFLFVGDAERDEERDLLALGTERLRADVLKVGHHGSTTSTSSAFVGAVAPSEAILSVGIRNRFGHPGPATLRTLSAAGARVWRTDRDGAVTAWTDGSRLEVHALAR